LSQKTEVLFGKAKMANQGLIKSQRTTFADGSKTNLGFVRESYFLGDDNFKGEIKKAGDLLS